MKPENKNRNINNYRRRQKSENLNIKPLSYAKTVNTRANIDREENAEILRNYYEPNLLTMSSSSSLYEVWDQSNFNIYLAL